MRAPPAIALTLLLALAPAAAAAQGRLDSAPKAVALPLAAQDYAQAAALSDRFLVESGRLAVSRARSDDLRGFANMMVDEHTASSGALDRALSQAGLPLPITTSPGKGRMAQLDALQQPSGRSKEFDERYLGTLIQAQKEALALHRNYAERGDNEILRAYAANAAAMIQADMDLLEKLPR